ncbi:MULTISPECIES: putative quinol monooxygenase [unclassified Mycoplasma]|uniref:putative quinol monooxygenase n=1 Tax=unclassified Mycoplasma TaxID=2683645 RepID=UPI00211C51D0|nr:MULTISPECIES: antibiotic biosynthesis monooxygenase [unclassified Mycoplasma]UUM20007.1 antibiotic biosynthesis monooxygenase [Mycoplasma sp. 1578d]UUM24988.1 antibiotic biosynthesis monooxygenase [Mycoplasma sp. 3686d]
MIFAKATLYQVKEEKLKGFIDYIYILTKKTRMLSNNLSFEYGFNGKDIILFERWTSSQEYQNHIKTAEYSKELSSLEKMSKDVVVLYQMDTLS